MEIFNWFGGFLLDAVKVILVLGFLIFIHELGHFAVAKKVGIKVHEFALGFGNKLLSFTRGETTYSIRLFPIGGFVRMEGEEQQSDDERAFNKKSIKARMAVVFAGPIMNILFALLILFSLVLFSGKYLSNQIDTVRADSGAAAAGLQHGDWLEKFNGKPIRIWGYVNWFMYKNGGQDVNLTVIRNGKSKELIVRPTIDLNFTTNQTNVITSIKKDSGLDKAGLKVGDRIKSINGASITSPAQMEEVIRHDNSKSYIFSIEKNNKVFDKKIDAPFARRYLIGIEPMLKSGYSGELVSYSFWQSIHIVNVMLSGIQSLFSGEVSLNQVMGPVGIISEISSRQVVADILWLAAIISLNLGIVNLMPFPPLDGGKILTLGIEAVRRRPIKPENEAMISMVGFSLLILLMLVVTFNDIVRQYTGS